MAKKILFSKRDRKMRVGILTGGGDCPGLNAAIRAVVKRGQQLGFIIVGIQDGWKGLLEGKGKILSEKMVSGILPLGGTILASSRTNPFKIEGGPKKVLVNFKKLKLDVLIVIGGDDTLGVARKLTKSIPMVGIPKTIDNDLMGTDFCIGFHTAVRTAMEAIDKLHSTAESHHRVMILEVMGRNFGWIAVYAGLAGGADYILIPEIPIDIDQVCRSIKARIKRGKTFSIIVVAEGAKLKEGGIVTRTGEKDLFGHERLGGVGDLVASLIKEKTGIDSRCSNLGHVIRGGTPTHFDRILGTQLGVRAVEMVFRKEFGKAVVLRNNKIKTLPFSKIKGGRKVDPEIYKTAKIFFG